MNVRQVDSAEVAAVLALIDEYDRPRSPRPPDDDLTAIYTAIVQCGGCIVGAFSDDKMVGTCTVNLCANLSWSGRPYAMIENVIVSKAHRGKGIGKAMLRYATEFAQQSGCYKVSLMTGSQDPATHRFYKSAGFTADKQGYQIRFSTSQPTSTDQ